MAARQISSSCPTSVPHFHNWRLEMSSRRVGERFVVCCINRGLLNTPWKFSMYTVYRYFRSWLYINYMLYKKGWPFWKSCNSMEQIACIVSLRDMWIIPCSSSRDLVKGPIWVTFSELENVTSGESTQVTSWRSWHRIMYLFFHRMF